MKKRTGFVSNSSSASFVVSKSDLTYAEAQLLLGWENNDSEYWSICEDGDCIRGWTSMDNNDLWEYLERVKFPVDKIKFEDHS